MHAFLPPDEPSHAWQRCRRQAGFSLVEVAMAIGIIAVCFVALIALIPSGLGELRKAMDSNNDTRIVQSFVSMALAAEYKDLPALERSIFYFDDEGSPLDTSTDSVDSMKSARLYAARAFIQPAKVMESPDLTYSSSSRMVIAWGNMFETDTTQLESLTLPQLISMLASDQPRKLSIRSVTIAKTDGK